MPQHAPRHHRGVRKRAAARPHHRRVEGSNDETGRTSCSLPQRYEPILSSTFTQTAPPTRFDYLPALSDQRAIKVFDGKSSSTSFFAVSTPATGSFFGSSSPICTSTEA